MKLTVMTDPRTARYWNGDENVERSRLARAAVTYFGSLLRGGHVRNVSLGNGYGAAEQTGSSTTRDEEPQGVREPLRFVVTVTAWR